MALTEQDRQDIAQIVASALAVAIQDQRCACGLEAGQTREVGHLMGMVTDIGHGDTRAGVEAMRESYKQVNALSRVANRIGWIFLGVLATAISSGVVFALWEAFKRAAGKAVQ